VRGELLDSPLPTGLEMGEEHGGGTDGIWGDDLPGEPDGPRGGAAGYSAAGRSGKRGGNGDLQSGDGGDCCGKHGAVAVGDYGGISSVGEHSARPGNVTEGDGGNIPVYRDGYGACVFIHGIVFA